MKNKIQFSEIHAEDNRSQGDLTSLVESIKATGGKLLQPIILAPARGVGRYEVVDGRRRFAALTILGYTELTPDNYSLLDGKIEYEATAYLANTERRALSPLEEAQQICQMLKTLTAAEIADKLGKTINYVASRSRLAQLAGKWQDVLDHPEEYPQWTIAKLQLIARETPAVQKELEHLIPNNHTHSELWNRIKHYHCNLNGAPFDVKTCAKCPKRSDNQIDLFNDTTEATCLDAECYQEKSFEAAKCIHEQAPELRMVRGYGGQGTNAYKYADKHKVPNSWQVEHHPCKDGEKADGIVICGEGTGTLVKIKNAPAAAPTASDLAVQKAEEKAQKAEVKKQREVLRLTMQRMIELLPQFRSWDGLDPDTTSRLWGIILSLGVPGASYYTWEANMMVCRTNDSMPSFQDLLLEKFINSTIRHIKESMTNPQLDVNRKFERELCRAIGWDYQAMYSWANMQYNKGKRAAK